MGSGRPHLLHVVSARRGTELCCRWRLFRQRTVGHTGLGILSGTSMAAPHVAGAAAYLADALSLTTPAGIEQAVRARLYATFDPTPGIPYTPWKDQGNNAVNVVQVP